MDTTNDESTSPRQVALTEGLGHDPERADFEAWAYVRDYDVTHSKQNPLKYANERTQGAWQAWGHAASNWRESRDIAVRLLREVVATYDAYRRRGVAPARVEYEQVVEAIESARRGLGA